MMRDAAEVFRETNTLGCAAAAERVPQPFRGEALRGPLPCPLACRACEADFSRLIFPFRLVAVFPSMQTC